MADGMTESFSELYSAYAAGCLDPAFALLVETQSAIRPDIARSVAQADIISGVILERQAPADMTATALDSALGLIDALDTAETKARAAAKIAGEAVDELIRLPEPLRDCAIDATGTHGWKFTSPGIRRLSLDVDSEAEVELYRIEPGATVPRHTHSGNEYTLVVTGGFSDETGAYGPGDLSVKGPEDTHQPVGDPGEPCYALAVRDGSLRFTGMMGAIQRLLGA